MKTSRVDPEHATAVFRICQEALTNVTRHAQATEVQVRLEDQGVGLLLQVSDNGRGIPHDRLADAKSFGLLGMRERAGLLGGDVHQYVGRRRDYDDPAPFASLIIRSLEPWGVTMRTTATVRILVVDDHPSFRRGVKDILEEGFEGVSMAECGNAQEMLDHVRGIRTTLW